MSRESPPLSNKELREKIKLAQRLFGKTTLRSGEHILARNLRIVEELRVLSPVLPREVELAGLFYQLQESQRSRLSPEIISLLKDLDKIGMASHEGIENFASTIKSRRVKPGTVLVRMASALAALHNPLLPQEEKERIGKLALHIHAPVALAMGLNWTGRSIGNLALRHAYPKTFKEIDESLDKGEREFHRKVWPVLINQIRDAAEKMKVHYETSESIKQHYEVWRKLREILEEDFTPDASLLNDAVRMRVIIGGTDSHCYQMLQHLQKTPGLKVKVHRDYVKQPKANGYRSLHVLLQPRSSKNWYELQIRTRQMHEAAEGNDARQLHEVYKHEQLPPQQRELIADIAKRAKTYLVATWLRGKTFNPS